MNRTADECAPKILPWHAFQWEVLAKVRQSDRLGHALLLSGSRGVGKGIFARRLAAMLLCRNAEQPICGVCPSCRQLAAGAHPDFTYVTREDKKRYITVDAVRAMCAALGMTSHNGGSKIAIIDPVDALNHSGVNALLKTLEEPAPGTLLLLITEHVLALPATLRSRCQTLRFAVPAEEDTCHWLSTRMPESDAQSFRSAVDLARGAPLRALEILENGQVLTASGHWKQTMDAMTSGHCDPLRAASEIDREQADDFIRWFAGWLHDRLREPALGPAEAQALARFVPVAFDAARAITSNAKPQLVIQSLLIEVSRRLADSALRR